MHFSLERLRIGVGVSLELFLEIDLVFLYSYFIFNSQDYFCFLSSVSFLTSYDLIILIYLLKFSFYFLAFQLANFNQLTSLFLRLSYLPNFTLASFIQPCNCLHQFYIIYNFCFNQFYSSFSFSFSVFNISFWAPSFTFYLRIVVSDIFAQDHKSYKSFNIVSKFIVYFLILDSILGIFSIKFLIPLLGKRAVDFIIQPVTGFFLFPLLIQFYMAFLQKVWPDSIVTGSFMI